MRLYNPDHETLVDSGCLRNVSGRGRQPERLEDVHSHLRTLPDVIQKNFVLTNFCFAGY